MKGLTRIGVARAGDDRRLEVERAARDVHVGGTREADALVRALRERPRVARIAGEHHPVDERVAGGVARVVGVAVLVVHRHDRARREVAEVVDGVAVEKFLHAISLGAMRLPVRCVRPAAARGGADPHVRAVARHGPRTARQTDERASNHFFHLNTFLLLNTSILNRVLITYHIPPPSASRNSKGVCAYHRDLLHLQPSALG